MKRVEVILTQAIEADFLSYYNLSCKRAGIKCKFTKLENVLGQGNTDPKLADSVWPQQNTMFIMFVEDDFVPEIKKIMERLHSEYVGEGAAAFVTDAQNVL